MKKIILLSIVFFISSCAVQRYTETYFNTDFRPYTDSGFIISPLSAYSAQYKPIATVSIEFTPGVDKSYVNGEIEKEVRHDDIYATTTNGTKKDWHKPTPDEMLDKLVSYAKSLGANGLLDFRLEVIRDVRTNSVLYYRVSGFAVSF